jgi:hypothetical protein
MRYIRVKLNPINKTTSSNKYIPQFNRKSHNPSKTTVIAVLSILPCSSLLSIVLALKFQTQTSIRADPSYVCMPQPERDREFSDRSYLLLFEYLLDKAW